MCGRASAAVGIYGPLGPARLNRRRPDRTVVTVGPRDSFANGHSDHGLARAVRCCGSDSRGVGLTSIRRVSDFVEIFFPSIVGWPRWPATQSPWPLSWAHMNKVLISIAAWLPYLLLSGRVNISHRSRPLITTHRTRYSVCARRRTSRDLSVTSWGFACTTNNRPKSGCGWHSKLPRLSSPEY